MRSHKHLEVSTSSIAITVEIYSYSNCFSNCKKLRPGIKLPWGTFALSNARPLKNEYMEIEATQVVSTHFHAKNKKIFLVKANNTATRYNNIPGGTLTLVSSEQKKFIGLDGSDAHIFSQKVNNCIMLKLDFKLLTGDKTNANYGLSPDSSFTPETAYELALKDPTALTEQEKTMMANPAWGKVVLAIGRVQLSTVLPNLPFPAATPEMVAAIPDDKLPEMLEFAGEILNGNPADENDPAALAVLGLEEFLGAPDVSAWTTPATSGQVTEVTDTPAENQEAPASAGAAETPETGEEAPSTPAEPATTPVAETPATTSVQPTVVDHAPAVVNFQTATALVAAREKFTALKKGAEEALEGIDTAIIGDYLKMAQTGGAALPSGEVKEATEDLVVAQ